MYAVSKICRLCLNNERRAYTVNNTILQNVWERLTNLKFDNNAGRLLLCYICCAQLRRCHDLMQRAVKAEKLFIKYIINNKFEESKNLVSIIVSKAYEIDYNYAIEQQYNVEFKCGGTNALEDVKEDNVSVKEEVKEEFTEFNDEIITAGEKFDMEEINVEKDLDSLESIRAESNIDNIGTKECLKSDRPFRNLTFKSMFEKEIQIMLPRIDEDDLIRNHKNVFMQNNKTLSSEVINDKVLVEQRLPECTTTNASTDSHGEANQSNISSVNNSGKKFSCDICHYECSFKSTWNIHLRLHTAEKLYKCDLCDYSCLMKTQLNRHMQSKHINEKKNSCHICEKNFVGNLNRHLRIHTGDKPYKCDLCDYRCSQKGNLEGHFLCKHTKEKKYACQICEKKFVVNRNLKRHLRIHTGDKPYKCDLCNYRCSRKGALHSYIQYKHTKDKKYKCHICEMKFVTNRELNIHLRRHTGEKPYRCHLCDYRCSCNSNLKKHVKYKHTKEKNFSSTRKDE